MSPGAAISSAGRADLAWPVPGAGIRLVWLASYLVNRSQAFGQTSKLDIFNPIASLVGKFDGLGKQLVFLVGLCKYLSQSHTVSAYILASRIPSLENSRLGESRREKKEERWQ